MATTTKEHSFHDDSVVYALFPRSSSRTLVLLVLVLLTSIGCFATIRETLRSFLEPLCYRRDFLQDYLLVRTFMLGDNPYQEISALAANIFPSLSVPIFPHPSPHPPSMIPLLAVLGTVDFQTAQYVWFCAQFAVLVAASGVVGRLLHWKKRETALWCGVLVASKPVYADFVQGQFGVVAAGFVVFGFYFLSRKRQLLAGICIGVACALKLVAAPIFLWMLYRRQWRQCLGVLAVLLVTHGVMIVEVDWRTLDQFYRGILPTVSKLYSVDLHNFSILSIPAKLAYGVNTGVGTPMRYPALASISIRPELVAVVCALFSAVVVALRITAKSDSAAWSMILLWQTLFSPLTWVHGFTLPLVIAPLLARDANRSLTSWPWLFFLLVLVMADFSGDLLANTSHPIAPYLGLFPSLVLFAYLVKLLFAAPTTRPESA